MSTDEITKNCKDISYYLKKERNCRKNASKRVVQMEVKVADGKEQLATDEKIESLQQATHILGVEGVFSLPNGHIMYGSGAHFDNTLKPLSNIINKFVNDSKLEIKNHIGALKKFQEACETYNTYTNTDNYDIKIQDRLSKGKAVILEIGTQNHSISIYAFVEKKSIKLILCNRGDTAKSVKTNGTMTYIAPFSPLAVQAIINIFKYSTFSTPTSVETFYKKFYKIFLRDNYQIETQQELKPQKIGNCTWANKKSLLSAIVPKELYKAITKLARQEQIILLIKIIKKKMGNRQIMDVDKFPEFKILQSYFRQNMASALDGKTGHNKKELVAFAIEELHKIIKTYDGMAIKGKKLTSTQAEFLKQIKIITSNYEKIKKAIDFQKNPQPSLTFFTPTAVKNPDSTIKDDSDISVNDMQQSVFFKRRS